MTPEGIVVAAVERYFSQPKFRQFSIQKEYTVQMGSDNRRADVVLLEVQLCPNAHGLGIYFVALRLSATRVRKSSSVSRVGIG